MDGLEGQNRKLVLNAGMKRQPVDRSEEGSHTVGVAREVNQFSSRIMYRDEGACQASAYSWKGSRIQGFLQLRKERIKKRKPGVWDGWVSPWLAYVCGL